MADYLGVCGHEANRLQPTLAVAHPGVNHGWHPCGVRQARPVVVLLTLLASMTGVPNARAARPAASTAPGGAPSTQPASAPASQPTSAPAHTIQPPFSLTGRTLTGDWLGLRPALQDVGIDVQFYYNNHFMSVLDGGRSTGGGKNSGTVDWFITADLGRMKLIPDADMLVQARAGWGYSINPYTGTTPLQDVNDDADGRQELYVDQLWYRQFFWDHKLSVQLGYLDFQTIVDRNVFANIEDRQFMNASLDNNPLLPTAAVTGPGIAASIQPVPWYTLIGGIGDAQGPSHAAPDPYYKPGFSTAFHDEAWFVSYLEQNLSPRIPTKRGPLAGNYRFGLVYDPRVRTIFRKADLPQRQRGNDYGFYTSFDQVVFRESDKDDQGLGLFFRYAYRHGDISRFDHFWSTGLSYTGLLPDRDRDTFGFAVAQLRSSEEFRSEINRDSGAETVYELYYAIPITPWVVVTPDLQYIDNPGASDTIGHVIVGGVRVRVSF